MVEILNKSYRIIPHYEKALFACNICVQMKDWLLALVVLLLVALDVIILVIYTSLECAIGTGATRVVNREQEISVIGVSYTLISKVFPKM